MRRISLFVAILAMALISGITFGQTTSGDLVGTVKDPSGAIVSNANVTVTNEATGVAVSVTTGSSGEFRAANLLPGQYDLAISSAGFQPYTLHGVTIELNKTATKNVTLSIGTTATVEVTAEAGVALDTTSTNLTQAFSNTELSVPSVHRVRRIDRLWRFERLAAEPWSRLRRRYRHWHRSLHRRTASPQQQLHH